MRDINRLVTRQVMALAIPVALVVMILAAPAIRAWVGPSFHQSAEVAVILAAGVIVSALAVTPRTVMTGSGSPRCRLSSARLRQRYTWVSELCSVEHLASWAPRRLRS